jgi:outer membrane protein
MLAPGTADAQVRVLTLDQAVSTALVSNPSITASKESGLAARHKEEGSWTGYLPQVVANMSYKRATANSALSPWIKLPATMSSFGTLLSRETSDSYNNLSASLGINQTIWDFGRTMGANQAAKAQVVASAADVSTTTEAVSLQVIQAYYAVLATREAVLTAEETLGQMQKHVQQAKIQADAGTRQRIDVARAQSDLATAEMALIRMRNGHLLAKVALDAAMGGDGDAEFEVVDPPEPAVLELDVEEATRRAVANRPEFRSLAAKVSAARAGVMAARSAWFPALQATGGVAWQGYKFTDLPYNWYAGASLTWNALSGVPAHAATQEAQANVRSLEALLKSLQVNIRSEAHAAVLAYREAQQRMQPAAALVESARQTLALAEGRYAAGSGSIMEVTDAQAIKVQASSSLIGARYELQTARARLLKAIGPATSAEVRN